VFLSTVYFKQATFSAFLFAMLSCSPIVISILTFLHELFELIKMMMMMITYKVKNSLNDY